MKKIIATTSFATMGIAAVTLVQGHDAEAAEYSGYDANDPTSYSYTYTIDQNGQYHFDWQGNWSPDQFFNTTSSQSYTTPNYYNPTTSYASQPQEMTTTTAVAPRTSNEYQVTTIEAPVQTTATPQSSGYRSVSTGTSGMNLYTVGQCTYYVFDRVGGTIGSTWGNANNWANAASNAGYTVNQQPATGAIMQSSAGAFSHVAYVESVNADGSFTVSEMNYGHGPGVVTTRTLSANQAANYQFIH
ncbi:CHAP domain-containing protein [Staphylococcus sp. 11261D007BR]